MRKRTLLFWNYSDKDDCIFITFANLRRVISSLLLLAFSNGVIFEWKYSTHRELSIVGFFTRSTKIYYYLILFGSRAGGWECGPEGQPTNKPVK